MILISVGQIIHKNGEIVIIMKDALYNYYHFLRSFAAAAVLMHRDWLGRGPAFLTLMLRSRFVGGTNLPSVRDTHDAFV